MPFIEIGSAINAINNIVQGIKDKKLKQAELLVELEKLKTNLYMFEKDLKFREDSSPTGIAKKMAKLHTELFACPECQKLTLEKAKEIHKEIKKRYYRTAI